MHTISDNLQHYNQLKRNLNELKARVQKRQGARDQLERVRNQEQKALDNARQEQVLAHQAHLFLLMEIAECRQKATDTIENMGTSALSTIYGPGYRLLFNTHEEKRKEGANNFKMDIQIGSPYDTGELLTGLAGERGGGVTEIVAFALRIAALNWLGYNGPLFMDEAYKSMSHDHKITSVASFLKQVSEETGLQIIFATHMVDIFGKVADRIIYVEKTDGIATCTVSNPDQLDFEPLDDEW